MFYIPRPQYDRRDYFQRTQWLLTFAIVEFILTYGDVTSRNLVLNEWANTQGQIWEQV